VKCQSLGLLGKRGERVRLLIDLRAFSYSRRQQEVSLATKGALQTRTCRIALAANIPCALNHILIRGTWKLQWRLRRVPGG
jgi:hypothetical protein